MQILGGAGRAIWREHARAPSYHLPCPRVHAAWEKRILPDARVRGMSHPGGEGGHPVVSKAGDPLHQVAAVQIARAAQAYIDALDDRRLTTEELVALRQALRDYYSTIGMKARYKL